MTSPGEELSIGTSNIYRLSAVFEVFAGPIDGVV